MSVWQFQAYVEGKVIANGGAKQDAPSLAEFNRWKAKDAERTLHAS